MVSRGWTRTCHFTYEATTDWKRLNAEKLSRYQVVVFLDTRPEDPAQRDAFGNYMEHGGAWMGFHFAGFALTPSGFLKIGTGITTSSWARANTWATPGGPPRRCCGWRTRTIRSRGIAAHDSSPRRTNGIVEDDLRANPGHKDAAVHRPGQLPAGDRSEAARDLAQRRLPGGVDQQKVSDDLLQHGPQRHGLRGGTNRALSSTFSSAAQNDFITRALVWLGTSGR